MKLTNARQSIHDAFALHLSGPIDNIGGGSAKFNSNRWLQQVGFAGYVIHAVMTQPAHLRGTAIFLNAPDNTMSAADVISMKQAVWTQFMAEAKKKWKTVVPPEEQGALIANLDRLLMGYRARAWHPKSQQHTTRGIFDGFETPERLTTLANRLLDVLAEFDGESLKPVWKLIDTENENDEKERSRLSETRALIGRKIQQGMSFKDAKREAEEEYEKAHSSAA